MSNIFSPSYSLNAKPRDVEAEAQAYAQQKAQERARAAVAPKAVNTESVQPVTKPSSTARLRPNFTGEPAAGQMGQLPNGSWEIVHPGTRAVYRSYRPYYTDAHTHKTTPKFSGLGVGEKTQADAAITAGVARENHPI